MDKQHQQTNYQQAFVDRLTELQKGMVIPKELASEIPTDFDSLLHDALRHSNTFKMCEPIEVIESIANKFGSELTMHEFVNACNAISMTTAHDMGMDLSDWIAMRKEIGRIAALWEEHNKPLFDKAQREIQELQRKEQTKAQILGNGNGKQIKLS